MELMEQTAYVFSHFKGTHKALKTKLNIHDWNGFDSKLRT